MRYRYIKILSKAESSYVVDIINLSGSTKVKGKKLKNGINLNLYQIYNSENITLTFRQNCEKNFCS